MVVNWREKIGAHHKGAHPLLIEIADRIEDLEEYIRRFGRHDSQSCYRDTCRGGACLYGELRGEADGIDTEGN